MTPGLRRAAGVLPLIACLAFGLIIVAMLLGARDIAVVLFAITFVFIVVSSLVWCGALLVQRARANSRNGADHG